MLVDLLKPRFSDLLGPFLTPWSWALDTEVVELVSDIEAWIFSCLVIAYLH